MLRPQVFCWRIMKAVSSRTKHIDIGFDVGFNFARIVRWIERFFECDDGCIHSKNLGCSCSSARARLALALVCLLVVVADLGIHWLDQDSPRLVPYQTQILLHSIALRCLPELVVDQLLLIQLSYLTVNCHCSFLYQDFLTTHFGRW